MCMVVDVTDENSNITLEDIHKYCEYLNTASLFDEEECKKIFDEIDTNNDGFISISQFFQFVSKTNELFMPICEFRLSLINHFFPHNLAINILHRRSQVYKIREYKIMNNGAYPNTSCMEQIMELLFGFPNKYKFDYDPNENISIYDITRTMILKYKKDAFIINNSQRLLCAKKQIGKVIDLPKIRELDQIFASFGYNSTKQCTGGGGCGGGDDESRNNSRTSLSQQQVDVLNKKPHSILKHTGSYSQMHSAKSIRGCGRKSCEGYSFDNKNRFSKNIRNYKSANQSLEHISPKSPGSYFDIPGYVTQTVI